MHGPSLSSQDGRLECLHAWHEGVICFRGRTTLESTCCGIGDGEETELKGQGSISSVVCRTDASVNVESVGICGITGRRDLNTHESYLEETGTANTQLPSAASVTQSTQVAVRAAAVFPKDRIASTDIESDAAFKQFWKQQSLVSTV
ncbi:hypothetical protein F2P81_007872 [Scophthalmus maximus]|uniref:Uncharacterized protein n=1 Tax=Scophthalmus maximus TaxID=52904 RepID=A0A6A4T0S8_SCOMX|nr:hypothetical protein F2P81_007872 [Scophthalmus maximus]